MDPQKIFSERIKALRKATKLTQKQVADVVGITEVGYQHYEGRRRVPSFRQLIALADFFDVSLDYLVGRSNDPTRLP